MAKGVGRGVGGGGRAGEEQPVLQKRTGVYLFMSDTTQFDFPHKRSNNISVTVNYTPPILPKLTRWHVGRPPDGVLETSAATEPSGERESLRGTETKGGEGALGTHTHTCARIHTCNEIPIRSSHAEMRITDAVGLRTSGSGWW